jgi:hypothetical protein
MQEEKKGKSYLITFVLYNSAIALYELLIFDMILESSSLPEDNHELKKEKNNLNLTITWSS